MTRLITMAQAENRTIDAAYYQLQAATARLQAAQRGLLPQGSVSASVTRTNQALGGGGVPDGGPQTPPGTPGATGEEAIELYSAGADLAWELDLFGRLRAAARQASASAAVQQALLADTERLVAARTAEAYLTWLEARSRRDVAVENLAAQQDALRLVRQQFDLGQIAEFDFRRQRTQTRITEAGVLQLQAAEAEALSALALITGNTVPDLLDAVPQLTPEAPAPALPGMRPALDLADPAMVLRRRPDVRAAEYRLASANAGVEGATANLFPQVSLTGSISSVALEPENIGSDESFSWSYGPRLSWPVFSLPQLLAQTEAAGAQARAAMAGYEQAVLDALTETDAALLSYSRAVERAAVLAGAQADAIATLELARARYRAGEDSLLSFLDAQRTALETEDLYVSARINAYQSRVAVHRALAQ